MEDELSCSWCGKNRREVRKLVVSPKASACDECAELMINILAEEADAFDEALSIFLREQWPSAEALPVRRTDVAIPSELETADHDIRCSLCEFPASETNKVIAGSSVYACTRCVLTLFAVVSGDRAAFDRGITDVRKAAGSIQHSAPSDDL